MNAFLNREAGMSWLALGVILCSAQRNRMGRRRAFFRFRTGRSRAIFVLFREDVACAVGNGIEVEVRHAVYPERRFLLHFGLGESLVPGALRQPVKKKESSNKFPLEKTEDYGTLIHVPKL